MRKLKKHAKGDGLTGRHLTVRPDMPAPTIMAEGIGGVRQHQHEVGAGAAGGAGYRVPTMAEVAQIPWNGLTVASTFSGCGGSCTGYRMAGYRVAWASEFVPAAADSYDANKAPGSTLDRRDVRTVTAAEILAATGLKEGELDVFDGSPPCQAFSTAGKRHKGWGEEKRYEGGHSQRNEDLFWTWVKLLRGLMPKTFVAENVSGLVKGTCKGVFLEILASMKASGYRVTCKLLDASRLGVPQSRVRTVFVGVREDVGVDPPHPRPLRRTFTVADALPWLASISNESTSAMAQSFELGKPSPSIVASGQGQRLTVTSVDPYGKEASVDPTGPAPTIRASSPDQLKVVWSGRHAQGLERGVADGPAPTINATPGSCKLGPAMSAALEGVAEGGKSDKYFQLQRASRDAPSPTVTGPSGGGLCHPTEARRFSIAELVRLCGFPDDYALPANYAKAWRCLGNSVPPVMMFWVARALRDEVLMAGRGPWPHDPRCLVDVAGV